NRTGTRKTGELEEVEAAHILFRPQVSQETMDELMAKITRFKNEATAANATTLATELGLTQEGSRKAAKDQPIGNFGKDEAIEKFVFESAEGALSDVIDRSEAF